MNLLRCSHCAQAIPGVNAWGRPLCGGCTLAEVNGLTKADLNKLDLWAGVAEDCGLVADAFGLVCLLVAVVALVVGMLYFA